MRFLRTDIAPAEVPAGGLSLAKRAALVGNVPESINDATWLEASWHLVEAHCQRFFLPGVGVSYREATYEIALDPRDPFCLSIMPTARNTPNAIIHEVQRWDGAAYQDYTDFNYRPGSRWCPTDRDAEYRLVARAIIPDVPAPVTQAVIRTSSWLRHYGPSESKGNDALAAPNIPISTAGAVLRSGAAELLISYR